MASIAKQAGAPVLSPEDTAEFERRIAEVTQSAAAAQRSALDLAAWFHRKLAPAREVDPLDVEEELDIAPADDSQWSPEDQAAIKAAEAQIANGTARIVWEEDLPAADAEIHRMKG